MGNPLREDQEQTNGNIWKAADTYSIQKKKENHWKKEYFGRVVNYVQKYLELTRLHPTPIIALYTGSQDEAQT